MIINKPIEIIYAISEIAGYGFGKDKLLYNLKTKHIKKQCYNNGSIGYWLNGKFYSLKKLRPMLTKYIEPKKVF